MAKQNQHPQRSGDHQSNVFPIIRTIEGNVYAVDQCGIIFPGRQWEPKTPPPEAEIQLAMNWLAECVSPIKTCGVDSYGAKHAVEHWAARYVCNGAMIVAAHRAGWRQSHRSHVGLNTSIGISLRSYRLHLRSAEVQS